jgi:glycosyltransferase involved in cell wall biosynthesis
MQVMKMAEALSKKVRNYELITSGDVLSIIARREPDFWEWYGISNRFVITRMPVYLRKKPFSEHYCGGKSYYLLAALYSVIKAPALIYVRSIAGIGVILHKTGLPVIWEHHTILPEYVFQNLSNYRNLIGFITTTPELAGMAIKAGMAPEKIIVEQSAVNLQNFLPYRDKEEARRSINLRADRPVVTYVGHLFDKKGIPTILDVAGLMPSVDFMLVGGWETDVERVRGICAVRNLNNVRLIGHVFQPDLPDYFYASDVLILPTGDHPDHTLMGSQLKLFEYMASRRPFVASALPTIRTVLRDGINALLAEPDNAASFRDAIKRLIDDSELGDRISEQAYRDVQYYTWDKRAERILQFAENRLLSKNVA